MNATGELKATVTTTIQQPQPTSPLDNLYNTTHAIQKVSMLLESPEPEIVVSNAMTDASIPSPEREMVGLPTTKPDPILVDKETMTTQTIFVEDVLVMKQCCCCCFYFGLKR
jgi:hypothetical protein